MKSNRLISITALTLMLGAGLVQAGDDSHIMNQNLSKRPYQAAPSDSKADNADQWDGATLVKDVEREEKAGPTQYQKFRINMFGQRPYMDGNK